MLVCLPVIHSSSGSIQCIKGTVCSSGSVLGCMLQVASLGYVHDLTSASILLCRLHEVIQSGGSMHLPGLGVVLRGSGFPRLQ